MAIQFDVLKEVQTGLKRKSVFVVLEDTQTGEKKQTELTGVPLDVTDIESYVANHPTLTPRRVLRDAGAIDTTMLNQSRERGLDAYYRGILDAIETAIASGGGLDDALAAARTAIATNTRGRARVEEYVAALNLTNQPETVAEKRDLLLCIEQFAIKGLLKGLLRG